MFDLVLIGAVAFLVATICVWLMRRLLQWRESRYKTVRLATFVMETEAPKARRRRAATSMAKVTRQAAANSLDFDNGLVPEKLNYGGSRKPWGW